VPSFALWTRFRVLVGSSLWYGAAVMKVSLYLVHRLRVRKVMEGIVADISALETAVADLEAGADAAEAQVLAAVQAGQKQVADLQAQIDALSAGDTITQEQIDALTASVQRADESITAISEAVAPIVEGEPEPEPQPAP